jgi:YggT family protein
MSRVVEFLADTFLWLILLVFLLRVLLQWSRADFRQPIAQAIVQLTNPLIMPLRRVLPPVGRIDTASVVGVLLAALLYVGVLFWLRYGVWPAISDWLWLTLIELVRTTLRFYLFVLFVYALLSWIAPVPGSPAQALLHTLCEPLLGRLRRAIPPIAGLDFSAFIALVIIYSALLLLP